MKKIYLSCALLLAMISPLCAQTPSNQGRLSGLLFGDYFWMAENHNSGLEGQNGFRIRRVYLTYDREISDSFSARVRLEMKSEGDFITSAKMTPYVKDAYLRWNTDHHQITAGISSPPTFDLTEDVWGYRSVEKSPLDLQSFGSSRDFGIAAKGDLGGGGKLQYHFMFGNGNGNRSEIDKGKKWMLALSYYLTDHLVVQAYSDWNDLAGNTDYYTLQGFAGYQSDGFNAGLLYAHQKRTNFFTDADENLNLNLDILSGFANFMISEKTTGLLRVDHMFESNPDVVDNDFIPFSGEAESTLMIGGVDVALDEKVHLIPNIEMIVYGKNPAGEKPGTDIIAKLTLFFRF